MRPHRSDGKRTCSALSRQLPDPFLGHSRGMGTAHADVHRQARPLRQVGHCVGQRHRPLGIAQQSQRPIRPEAALRMRLFAMCAKGIHQIMADQFARSSQGLSTDCAVRSCRALTRPAAGSRRCPAATARANRRCWGWLVCDTRSECPLVSASSQSSAARSAGSNAGSPKPRQARVALPASRRHPGQPCGDEYAPCLALRQLGLDDALADAASQPQRLQVGLDPLRSKSARCSSR